MKKILLSLTFLSLTSWAFAQIKGIKFEEELNWDEVRAKAKTENKYIFVDVFATWCGPCRAMDKDVYPSEKVGVFMNNNFLSIKVQADTSKVDNEQVKSWYSDARELLVANQVKSFPTFLFFSPDGKLVDKAIGYSDSDTFIKISGDALDPQKQYYNILNNYRKGLRKYDKLPGLIRKSRILGEDTVAKNMANDYLYKYLDKLPEKELFNKDYLLFATTEAGDLFTSDSRIFQLIYNNPKIADELVGVKGFAQSVISWRITKEELYNKLWGKDNKPLTKYPDWNKLKAAIKSKYDDQNVESLITPSQFLFYQVEKNWDEYTKLADLTIEKYPPKKNGKRFSTAIGGIALRGPGNDAWGLNGIAWTLFENSTDTSLLKRALFWSDLSIQLEDPMSNDAYQSYDTKANLLYKLGRVKEAIAYERKGIEVLGRCDLEQGFKEYYVKKYNEVILKMIKGEKTWKVISNNVQ